MFGSVTDLDGAGQALDEPVQLRPARVEWKDIKSSVLDAQMELEDVLGHILHQLGRGRLIAALSARF